MHGTVRRAIAVASMVALGVVGLTADRAWAGGDTRVGSPGAIAAVPTTPPQPRSVYIGATLTANSAGWGQVLQRSESSGALVLMVLPSSPAAAAGLLTGDVVVAVDGEAVRDDQRFLALLRAGEVVRHTLTVIRPGGRVLRVDLRTDSTPPRSLSEVVSEVVAAQPTASNRYVFAKLLPDPRAALSILDALIQEFPEMADLYAARAERMLELGPQGDVGELASQSTPILDRALALDPQSIGVVLAAARIRLRAGDSSGAEQRATDALAVDEGSANAHLYRAQAMLIANRPRDAVPDLLRSIQLDPYLESAYDALSAAYSLVGEAGAAKATGGVLAALQAGLRVPGASLPGRDPVGAAAAAVLSAFVGVASSVFRRRRPSPARGRAAAESTVLLTTLEALTAVGAFSVIVPPLGRALGLSPGASIVRELLDHTVPGVCLIVVCVFSIVDQLQRPGSLRYRRLVLSVASAAAVWMTGTHLALVAAAIRGRVPIETALWHSIAGPVSFVLVARLQWIWEPDEISAPDRAVPSDVLTVPPEPEYQGGAAEDGMSEEPSSTSSTTNG